MAYDGQWIVQGHIITGFMSPHNMFFNIMGKEVNLLTMITDTVNIENPFTDQ